MSTMTIYAVLVLVELIFYIEAAEWSYQNQENWPPTCHGTSQSPINIPPLRRLIKSSPKPFKFSPETEHKRNATLTNTGHSVEIRFLDNSTPPVISGGELQGEYVLSAFHFHWPSEHTINGHRYPLEGHFVYYSKNHSSLQTALGYKNGVAVLGVFYELTFRSNPAFRFVQNMQTVAHTPDRSVPLTTPIALREFLPQNLQNYFRYEGSLTTPQCNEVVTWSLFQSSSSISLSQLKILSNICDEEGRPLRINNRKLQKLNRRLVFVT